MMRIKELAHGVALFDGERVVAAYAITKGKTKWKIKLTGASYGLEIGYYVPLSQSEREVRDTCIADLEYIIDELKEMQEAKA